MVTRLWSPTAIVLPLLFSHFLISCAFVAGEDSQPDDALGSSKKASKLIELRQYDEALRLLNAAIGANPNLSEACQQRATVLRRLCRFEDSEKDYKRLLELKPGISSVEKELSQLLRAQDALNSANTHFDSGDFSKALDYINKIVLVYSPSCLKQNSLRARFCWP